MCGVCLPACGAQVQSQAGDFDIPSYGHQEVDRCGVLMDAWAQHAAFLECKKEVSQCKKEVSASECWCV